MDPYRAQIVAGLAAGLTAGRIFELVREDAPRLYRGGDNVFRSLVRRVRREQEQQDVTRDVPIRFAGLPCAYQQVDWGAVWSFPFAQQPAATRSFLSCCLKYGR